MYRTARAVIALLGALMLVVAHPRSADAQGVTTAAVTGQVTSAEGQGLAGIQIVVTNTSTGATRGVLTREDGRYLLPGLQPGGPYRIEARGLGYAPEAVEDVTLAISQTQRFDFTLGAQAVEIEGIAVNVDRSNVISRDRMGTSTVVEDSAISRLPTITRDFTDFTRLSPQISTGGAGTSAAGRNNRFNTIQIDGSVNNDLFGLGSSGTPGGQVGAKPITLDAIQEFQVVLSPTDVRQGGFTGAGINAVTRSGSNQLEGSFSYFNKNDALIGTYTQLGGSESAEYGDFAQHEFAGSLGGPIVRDRLHFFIAGEVNRRNTPVNVIAGQGDAEVSMEEVEEVADILRSQYGYEPGTLGALDRERTFNNLFARLDWNIDQNHRFTLRNNWVDATEDDFSRYNDEYPLGGHLFVRDHVDNSLVAQLNSTIGNNVFNELRLGYTLVRDERVPADRKPSVQVFTENGAEIWAGSEQYSGANVLDQDAFALTNDLTFALGRHNVTLGTHNEYFTFSNLFVRNAYGYWRFDSIEDLRNGAADRYEYSYLLPGGDERAEFPVLQAAFYLQDQVSLTDNLTVTAGLRYDYTALPDDPNYNPQVEQFFGRNTAEVPAGGLFNPRFGFNWDVYGNRAAQLRGGFGFYSGRTPGVWVSNAYGNTGMEYVRFTCTDEAVPGYVSDSAAQPTSCAGSTTLAPNEINTVDPDFEMPQVWRANLAFDHQLPLGFVGTVEGLYTRTVNDILYRDLSVAPTGEIVEGRPRYARRFSRDELPGIGNVYDLSNTDEGYSYSITAGLQRRFLENFSLDGSYTFSQAKDVAYGGSSQASSNFRYRASFSPNEPRLTTSDFEVPHLILVSGSFEANLIERAPTNISLIYVGESGRPYSLLYNGDVNGDGQFSNDLIYVPASAAEVRFEGTAAEQAQSWQNLDAYIQNTECLREARGEVLERNACREPWQNNLDLRIGQVIPTVRGQNLQLTLDVLNVLNLLNTDWGRNRYVPFGTDDPFRTASTTPDENGRVLLRSFDEPDYESFSIWDLSSRYQIQLGLRYSF